MLASQEVYFMTKFDQDLNEELLFRNDRNNMAKGISEYCVQFKGDLSAKHGERGAAKIIGAALVDVSREWLEPIRAEESLESGGRLDQDRRRAVENEKEWKAKIAKAETTHSDHSKHS
jgi:hypothetical protein